MEPILVINRRLKDNYGRVGNQARYRLSWSTSELEKRHGTFNDFYGPIFIRQIIGVKEVPKYPAYPDRWVLEVLSPQLGTDTVINHNGYEPLFVFDKNGEYLDPVWQAIEFIISRAETPVRRSLSEMEADDAATQMREEREFYEYISNFERGPLSTGEAVTVPNMGETK